MLACRNFVEFKRNSTVKKAFPSNEQFSGSKWVSTTQNVRNEFLELSCPNNEFMVVINGLEKLLSNIDNLRIFCHVS